MPGVSPRPSSNTCVSIRVMALGEPPGHDSSWQPVPGQKSLTDIPYVMSIVTTNAAWPSKESRVFQHEGPLTELRMKFDPLGFSRCP